MVPRRAHSAGAAELDGGGLPTVLDEQSAYDLARRWALEEPVGPRAVPGGWVPWTGGAPEALRETGMGRRVVIDAAAGHGTVVDLLTRRTGRQELVIPDDD